MKKSPTFAIEGAGKWSGIHANNFAQILGPDSLLGVSCSENRFDENMKSWPSHLPRPEHFHKKQLSQKIESGDISPDFIVITVPPKATAGVVNSHLIKENSGKSLLVEKPLALNLDEIKYLLFTAKRFKINIVMTSQTVYSPSWREYISGIDLNDTKKISIKRRFPYSAEGERYGHVDYNLGPHSFSELYYILKSNRADLSSLDITSAEYSRTEPNHKISKISDSVKYELVLLFNGNKIEIDIDISQASTEGLIANNTNVKLKDDSLYSFFEPHMSGEKLIYKNGKIKHTSKGENTVFIQNQQFLLACGIEVDGLPNKLLMNLLKEREKIRFVTGMIERGRVKAAS